MPVARAKVKSDAWLAKKEAEAEEAEAARIKALKAQDRFCRYFATCLCLFATCDSLFRASGRLEGVG